MAAAAAPPAAAPAVLLFPAVATPAAATLSGRVVKDLPGGSTAWSHNLKRLAAPGWVGVPVEVALAGARARVVSGHDGDFEVTLTAPGDHPFAGHRLTKQPMIRGLLSRLPQPVILLGDSGERDPEVYAQIRAEFPGRVAAVYIHDVGKSADPSRSPDMVLFRHPGEASADAARRGLLTPACHAAAFSPPGK